jgi:hypothetical protein
MPEKGLTRVSEWGRYGRLMADISGILTHARRTAARSVNALLSATYWQIGRWIVEHEQGGRHRAEYGDTLIQQSAGDLTAKHGRGFSVRGIFEMRGFYLGWQIFPTLSGELETRVICSSSSSELDPPEIPDNVWNFRNRADSVCGIRRVVSLNGC